MHVKEKQKIPFEFFNLTIMIEQLYLHCDRGRNLKSSSKQTILAYSTQTVFGDIIQTPIILELYLSPDIDECTTTPCQNGATCTDIVNDYKCRCVAGYTGNNCQTGRRNKNCVLNIDQDIPFIAHSCSSYIPCRAYSKYWIGLDRCVMSSIFTEISRDVFQLEPKK